MNVSLETRNPVDAQADVLVVGRHSDTTRPTPEMTALDKKLGGLLTEVLKSERFLNRTCRMNRHRRRSLFQPVLRRSIVRASQSTISSISRRR